MHNALPPSVRSLDFSRGSWFVLSWYQRPAAGGAWERHEVQSQDRQSVRDRMASLGGDVTIETSCVEFREYAPPEETGVLLSQYIDPPVGVPGTGASLRPGGAMVRLSGE